mgnify:CR=1 FL=1
MRMVFYRLKKERSQPSGNVFSLRCRDHDCRIIFILLQRLEISGLVHTVIDQNVSHDRPAAPTKYYSTEGTNVYFKLTKDGESVNPMTRLN